MSSPWLLQLPRDELFRRFIYFIQQGFTQSETVRLIDAQPLVLSFTSPEVDRHLGQVQTLFRFSGNIFPFTTSLLTTAPQVRLIVNEVPAVLVHPLARIKVSFVTCFVVPHFQPQVFDLVDLVLCLVLLFV